LAARIALSALILLHLPEEFAGADLCANKKAPAGLLLRGLIHFTIFSCGAVLSAFFLARWSR
jgi:hypothetical protein